MKNIITITGDLGSGKSTVAKIIAGKLHFQLYSTGDLQRNLAREKGLTSLELNRLSETNPEIDAQIDGSVVALARDNDCIIIDSRLAWHFVPAAFKVYLTVDPKEAAARIMAARRGKVEQYSCLEEACAKLAQRRASEEYRFKTLYNIDLQNQTNFDLVVDTTAAPPNEVAKKIIQRFKEWHNR